MVSFDGKTLKYTVGSREKTLTIKGNADVIYNDVACPNYDDGMLMPLSGKITYIENGSDYACITVKEYTNVVGYMTKAGMGDAEAVVVYDEKTKSTIGQ